MTVQECITGRRSIRRFTGEALSHELLAEVVSQAAYAPSWKNTQVTRYIAVEGPLKEKLARECTSIYPPNGDIMESAAAVIALTVVKGRSGYERDGSFSTVKGDGWQMFDAGVAAEAFCLAAHDLGLGTVILGLFDVEEASSLLGISENQELVALIPIGYPAEAPKAPRRKSVEDLLSYQS